METYMDTKVLLREQVLRLKFGIAAKQSEIEKLKGDVLRERAQRWEIDRKYKNIKVGFLQMRSELTKVLESLQKPDNDVGSSCYKEQEDTTNLLAIKLKMLSTQMHQRFENQNKECDQIKLNLTKINSQLADLDALFHVDCKVYDDESTSTSSKKTPGIPCNSSKTNPESTQEHATKETLLNKRVSVKTVRFADELILQRNQKILNTSVDSTNTSVSTSTSSSNASVPKEEHGVCTSMKNCKAFYCLCGRKFLHKSSLMQHICYYKLEKNFACHHCEKRFRNKSQLKKHVGAVHKKITDTSTDSEKPIVIAECMVVCRKCGEIFGTKRKLSQHQSITHKTSRNSSNNFGENATVQLLSNPKTPSKTEPKKETGTFALGRDGRYHGKDTSMFKLGFYCICGRRSISLATLCSHIIYYTMEWKFRCKMCSKMFLGANYLRAHLRKGHKIMLGKYRPTYGCRQCGKLLKSHIQFIEHRRRVHSKSSG